ncbi:MAG: hypothetical protein WBP11_01280 [Dokdonella sp.]
MTGRSFEHRRGWIEDRLLALSDIFAVGLYAYAVISNHVHVVLRIDPGAVLAWSDEEIATRWVRLFPVQVDHAVDPDGCRHKESALLGNAERLQLCRQRLGSLSWFMRSLNEPIARRANREDGCTGRFWEGRYKCQALLDEAALLACMSYVNLNPIRAGMADDLPTSLHTSAAQRTTALRADVTHAKANLTALRSSVLTPPLALNAGAYLELIDWTARQLRPDKRGRIAVDTPPILAKLGLHDRQWQYQVLGIESRYYRAIGSAAALIEKAQAMGQCWLKGLGAAQRLV